MAKTMTDKTESSTIRRMIQDQNSNVLITCSHVLMEPRIT